MSRLVYRKGVDLLAVVIPIICKKYPNVFNYIVIFWQIMYIKFQSIFFFIFRLTFSLEEMAQNGFFLNRPVKKRVYMKEYHCLVL